jgi:uncharacterized protein
MFLLDVNVLIALIDPLNSRFAEAHRWFASTGNHSWATCPLTENGTIRIVGNPRYPNSPGDCGAVAEVLAELAARPGHVFWPDDISLLDQSRIDMRRMLTSSQVTDSYLLALAVAHGGRLATFDQRIIPSAVVNGKDAIYLIR